MTMKQVFGHVRRCPEIVSPMATRVRHIQPYPANYREGLIQSRENLDVLVNCLTFIVILFYLMSAAAFADEKTADEKAFNNPQLQLVDIIQHETDNQPASDPVQQLQTDAYLKGSLDTAFELNPHLGAYPLTVEVTENVASLHGKVDDVIKRDLALEIASGLDGIKQVHNHIEVIPTLVPRPAHSYAPASTFRQIVHDASISASVKMRLLYNTHVPGLGINVDTRNAVVTLHGQVDSPVVRDLTEHLALNTQGVKKVENRLKIQTEHTASR